MALSIGKQPIRIKPGPSSPLLVKPIELFMREAKVTEYRSEQRPNFSALKISGQKWPPKRKAKMVLVFFLVCYGWKEQVKILVQKEWDEFRREYGKNNAYDHLMLESSPSRSNTCDVPRIICDDDPIEADGVKPRDKTCCFRWQNSWSNPRRFPFPFRGKNTFWNEQW